MGKPGSGAVVVAAVVDGFVVVVVLEGDEVLLPAPSLVTLGVVDAEGEGEVVVVVDGDEEGETVGVFVVTVGVSVGVSEVVLGVGVGVSVATFGVEVGTGVNGEVIFGAGVGAGVVAPEPKSLSSTHKSLSDAPSHSAADTGDTSTATATTAANTTRQTCME